MKKDENTTNSPWIGLLVAISILIFTTCTDEPIVTSDSVNSVEALSNDDDRDASGREEQQTFTAQLTGENERPTPIETHGKGQAIFKLSKDGTSLSYKVVVHNIPNVTQAHIHCGDAATAGPVVAFLFGFVATGVSQNGVLAEGVITNSNVIPRPDSQACAGGIANFEDLVEKMKAGLTYINVHTIAYPPGEIRGQIK